MKFMAAYNSKVIMLNLSFLLSIAFIPFSTAFLFENVAAQSALPWLIYNLNYIIATLLSYRLFTYVLDPKNGLCHEQHGKDVGLLKKEIVFQIVVYSLVILLAFINPNLASIGYPLLAFENRFTRKKKEIVSQPS